MSRWFRHYAGMMRDDKLVRAAMRSKQTVERVVWVWGAVLESAAEINDAGRFDLDVDEAAYFLRCDAADLSSIVNALCDLGRIDAGKVTKWGDRQFESDTSRERQQRYRDKRKSSPDPESDVTRPSPDGGVTRQETETDTKPEDKTAPPVLVAEGARALFDELWEEFPENPTSSETKAEAAFQALKASDQQLVLAAGRRYRLWFLEDCEARKRTEVEGLKFVPHLATWLAGDWRKADMLPVKSIAAAPDPNLTIVKPGTPDFEALTKHRHGKAPYVGNSGVVTVTKAELEDARAAA